MHFTSKCIICLHPCLHHGDEGRSEAPCSCTHKAPCQHPARAGGLCRDPGAEAGRGRAPHSLLLRPAYPIRGLLLAWARRAGSPPRAVPAPRAKPLGTRKPLQTMPWSLGIIDGVFTTSKRPVPGQTVKGNTSGPLGYRRL